MKLPSRARLVSTAVLPVLIAAVPAPATTWHFTDVTAAAGITNQHKMLSLTIPEQIMAGGVACGDYDNDGWLDLYHLGGNSGNNRLYRNNGNGTFTDVSVAAGVDVGGQIQMGATFADWTGDGWLDLFLGGVAGTRLKAFESNGDGTFTVVTDSLGVSVFANTFSPAFGDLDRDGDLDCVIGHWGTGVAPTHFWRNDGPGTVSWKYVSADSLFGYTGFTPQAIDRTFTYNLTDLNGDMWPDFTVASDFNTSHVWLNDGDGTFTDVTDGLVIDDDKGGGSAVGDYDNDGDMDWFVSSVYDTVGTLGDGNRLYRNDGGGTFVDVTTAAGVRDGQWGWGASMQDFDNDGDLDIAQVNGWIGTQWSGTPARLFVNNGDGTFTNMAGALGAGHVGQGRTLTSFDYDRDGDVDLFYFNTNQLPVLLRNDCAPGNWLEVKLVGPTGNTEGIGSWVRATVGATTQVREIRCGSNFNAQDPAEAHFGLGSATVVDQVEVTWTDGTVTTMSSVAGNQRLVIEYGSTVSAPLADAAASGAIRLLEAAPNPFRDDTRIRFRLAASAEVTVRVVDAGGRSIRSWSAERRASGEHVVAWDGRDDRGAPVASGIYWFVVQSGDERARGKITRIR